MATKLFPKFSQCLAQDPKIRGAVFLTMVFFLFFQVLVEPAYCYPLYNQFISINLLQMLGLGLLKTLFSIASVFVIQVIPDAPATNQVMQEQISPRTASSTALVPYTGRSVSPRTKRPDAASTPRSTSLDSSPSFKTPIRQNEQARNTGSPKTPSQNEVKQGSPKAITTLRTRIRDFSDNIQKLETLSPLIGDGGSAPPNIEAHRATLRGMRNELARLKDEYETLRETRRYVRVRPFGRTLSGAERESLTAEFIARMKKLAFAKKELDDVKKAFESRLSLTLVKPYAEIACSTEPGPSSDSVRARAPSAITGACEAPSLPPEKVPHTTGAFSGSLMRGNADINPDPQHWTSAMNWPEHGWEASQRFVFNSPKSNESIETCFAMGDNISIRKMIFDTGYRAYHEGWSLISEELFTKVCTFGLKYTNSKSPTGNPSKRALKEMKRGYQEYRTRFSSAGPTRS